MKLYIAKAEDRDAAVVVLARNGYTVRQGKEKNENKKTVYFVEVIVDDSQKGIN